MCTRFYISRYSQEPQNYVCVPENTIIQTQVDNSNSSSLTIGFSPYLRLDAVSS